MASITGLAIALILWPAGPVRSHIGDGTQRWLTGRRIAAHWTQLSDAPERRGRSVVHIIEFADYSCSYCKQAEQILDEFQDRWKNAGIGIRFISRGVLAKADRRAILAICSSRVLRFPTIHELFFDEPSSTKVRDLEGVAAALRTTPEILESCFTDEKNFQRLDDDIRWAQKLGVRGTPTFVGPGGFHRGIPTIADLERVSGLEGLTR
jgi:protein-disulfide isomerase